MPYTQAVAHLRDMRDLPDVPAKTKANTQTSNRPGWISRMFTVMAEARQRQAEREIARYLRSCGGKFTDEAEREIERRFLSNPPHW